jgi:hypothetical protein
MSSVLAQLPALQAEFAAKYPDFLGEFTGRDRSRRRNAWGTLENKVDFLPFIVRDHPLQAAHTTVRMGWTAFNILAHELFTTWQSPHMSIVIIDPGVSTTRSERNLHPNWDPKGQRVRVCLPLQAPAEGAFLEVCGETHNLTEIFAYNALYHNSLHNTSTERVAYLEIELAREPLGLEPGLAFYSRELHSYLSGIEPWVS